MIIKSLSRKNRSFEALYNYLTRDKKSVLNCFNLYSNPYSKSEVIKEFLDNAKYIKKARGKNYYYHEIISLNKNKLSFKEQQNILTDLTSRYIFLRAKNHLVFTALHKDKEHIHMHLMISANELQGSKRVRLSKKKFSDIQKSLEEYIIKTYPQLNLKKHYNKDFSKIKDKKEFVINSLKELFKTVFSKDDFEKRLKELNLDFYKRGKTQGVIFENKKYRLKTLGILNEYEEFLLKLEKSKNNEKIKDNDLVEQRREEMSKIRQKQYKKDDYQKTKR